MKKLIRSILNKFDIEIKRKNPELKNNLSFDDIYKIKINKNPIIFDVGANKGQSIERFKKIFPDSLIHAFEPNTFEYEILKNKYRDDKKIILNNFAVGDKKETKSFYITAKSGSSSFNKLNLNSEWLKKRSKQFNTSTNGYTKSIEKVNIITLDEYCKKK
jgi:FkbM family methyltransferase